MHIILIPPSEGKVAGGEYQSLGSLDGNSVVMYDRLISYAGDVSALLGVKDKALRKAIEVNKDILKSPTVPAIERYSGVVYEGIAQDTLSLKAKEFLNSHVRIVSALFGLLHPQDLIPDYKLKIEKLDAAHYWKPIITRQLQECYVIDCLPQTHRKAVNYKDGIKIDFIFYKNGKLMPAGHQGKLIKGKFIRWLCEQRITDPKYFSGFNEDGFKFDGHHFIKNQ